MMVRLKRSTHRLLTLGAALCLAAACEDSTVRRARTDCIQTKPRDPDRAIRGCTVYINHARSGDPHVAHAHYNRGLAYQDRNDFDSALADYTVAIRLNPTDFKAHNNRGNVYRARGQWDRAIADFDEALRLDSTHALIYTNRGNAYRDIGDYTRALADYDEAIKRDPQYAEAFRCRGRSC